MAIYTVKNQWGGNDKPRHDGGVWEMGSRADQSIVNINIASEDGGKSLLGTMIYQGEGPIGVRATQIAGNNYKVENQWGGEGSDWNPGGYWIIGGREGQNVVSLQLDGDNGGLNGTMVYEGEGPIGFEGSITAGTSYVVENQWGGENAEWNMAGTFILGTRKGQAPTEFDISSKDEGKTFNGTMTYAGEGPIGFKAEQVLGNNYKVENQWGGEESAWNDGGNMIIGTREGQNVIALKVSSTDDGVTLSGAITYQNEGPIGFKGNKSE